MGIAAGSRPRPSETLSPLGAGGIGEVMPISDFEIRIADWKWH
jgi:hypothetical protein